MKHYLKTVNRSHTNSYKWDSIDCKEQNIIPLWVADMDFATPKPIVDAVVQRAKHPVYGYVKVPNEYKEAVCNWFETQHEWHTEPQDVIYTTSVVTAISAIIKAVTKNKDRVLIQTPVYNCFFSSIENNGCKILANSLINKDGEYSIDFEFFEMMARQASVFILCNPHNPAGRCWTESELDKMALICKRHKVFVITDEIHCEIIMPGYKYTPFGIIADKHKLNYVQCSSISKTFNTAGLHIANIICKNEKYREQIIQAINANEVGEVNPFGVEALITAYTNRECKFYIRDLNNTIYDNYLLAKEKLKNTKIVVTPLEGTYLMWIDIRCFGKKVAMVKKELLRNYHIWVNEGTMYGSDGEGFLRINLATSPERIEAAMNYLLEYYNDKINGK